MCIPMTILGLIFSHDLANLKSGLFSHEPFEKRPVMIMQDSDLYFDDHSSSHLFSAPPPPSRSRRLPCPSPSFSLHLSLYSPGRGKQLFLMLFIILHYISLSLSLLLSLSQSCSLSHSLTLSLYPSVSRLTPLAEGSSHFPCC